MYWNKPTLFCCRLIWLHIPPLTKHSQNGHHPTLSPSLSSLCLECFLRQMAEGGIANKTTVKKHGPLQISSLYVPQPQLWPLANYVFAHACTARRIQRFRPCLPCIGHNYCSALFISLFFSCLQCKSVQERIRLVICQLKYNGTAWHLTWGVVTSESVEW